MKFLYIFIFVITLLKITSAINESKNDNTISVEIKNGKINGKTVTFDEQEVHMFLGIPYAEPPVGELRFKKPLPKTSWSEPIDATQWTSPCHQTTHAKDFLNDSLSEDCLHLNIWSPLISGSTDELKAVIFYIHGGALLYGSSNQKMHVSHVLSVKGDVVVVTINYRVGTLGFLYSGTDEAPGNVGLWDQVLALEWVNDNIKYFGGDPNQITIVGESAGSWSVSFLILSPITKNLFKNAIMMSGSALNHLDSGEPDSVQQKWLNGAKSIGCIDSENRFTPKIMKCLRDSSPELLSELMEGSELEDSNRWPPQVIIDGDFLPNRPLDMLKSGDYKKGVNLMIGTTEDEGSFILGWKIDSVKYNAISPQNLTYNEVYNELKTLSSALKSKIPINGNDVAKLYFTGLSDSNDFDLLRRTIGIALGDWYIGCPTIQFAKTLFKNDKKSNVYQYYYNSKLGAEKLVCQKWMGVCHANDIWPLFGIPFSEFDGHLDREREISAQFIDFVSTFAKTGKPSAQNGVDWPKYYTINDNIITPYYEITNEPKRNTNFGNGLKINECEYLWKQYLNKL